LEKRKKASLTSQDARKQAKAAAVLMSIIPALAVFFIASLMYLPDKAFPLIAQIGILAFTTLLAFAGYRIISKYPENILKLRQYIGEVAEGTLPQKIALLDTHSSDDLRYIEEKFNAILVEMRRKLTVTEDQLKVEQALRKTIEQQQQDLIQAERHRTMIQSLGAACHHIGQPATVLCMHLDLLKKHVTSDETRAEIDDSLAAVELIRNVLKKLSLVSEFKTVSYIEGGSGDEILAID